MFALSQDISSAIEESWLSHQGQVCLGVDWSLFPEAEKDAKVNERFPFMVNENYSAEVVGFRLFIGG